MNLDKYIYSHCVHPKQVKIYDAYEKQFVVRSVPCGHCLHCRITKLNEWVTRLYAQQRHSQYTYFVTLDYAPFDLSFNAAKLLAAETAAISHDLNINHKLGLHPLLLCKNHLNDFLKRLRKNLGFPLQYFACGEYGSKWSRPHFHIILFADSPIQHTDVERAWSIDGYKIGRVDFNDLVANGTTKIHNKDGNKFKSAYVFKYVCKYLMKSDFDFNKLATIEYHKLYFNSLQLSYEKTDTLFPELVKITDSELLAKNWEEYCKSYSPFVSCSRRPAIGLAYLQENVERFKKGDYRLFGLSKECSIFPRYFLRKAKESACVLRPLGAVSNEPSTPARIGYIQSLLDEITNTNLNIQTMFDSSAPVWRPDKKLICYYNKGVLVGTVHVSSLSFYDAYNKIMFVFDGYEYKLWQKAKGMYFSLGSLDTNSVLNYINSESKEFIDNFVTKFYYHKKQLDFELNESIQNKFDGDWNKFQQYVYQKFNDELASRKFKQTLINNSHITF